MPKDSGRKGKTMIGSSPRLEDTPELIHRIQLLLPEKDATRTCILSKSWLDAWSTNPILRFTTDMVSACKQQGIKYSKVVDATLLRYLRNNIPIQKLFLVINTENYESASLVETWIRSAAPKTCLKKLHLSTIDSISFTLPDEILSGKNLKTVSVTGLPMSFWETRSPVCVSSNTVIKCVSLRKLFLMDLHICEEVLNHLLSTCTLLQTIQLVECTGWNTMKVKNLRFLYRLRVRSNNENSILQIEDVPKLRLFSFESNMLPKFALPFNTDSLIRVTQLTFDGLYMDDGFFKMIKSKFPFLESLTLTMRLWIREKFDMRFSTLKSLYILSCNSMFIRIRVFAPQLQLFHYEGNKIPSLSFPTTAPKKIELVLNLTILGRISNPIIDHLLLVRLREILALLSEYDIKLTMEKFDTELQLNGDFDFIARNVGRLSLSTTSDEGSWEHLSFFDMFFSICHPKLVLASRDERFNSNSFCKLMLKEVLEKKTLMLKEVLEKKTRIGYWGDYLKSVEIKNPENGNWEILTDSWRSFLGGSSPHEVVYFKLNWSSL